MVLGVTAITVGMWACGVGGLGPVSDILLINPILGYRGCGDPGV